MSKLEKTILALLLVGASVIGAEVWSLVHRQVPLVSLGSVASGGEYQSTTTPTVGDGTLLCTGNAVLGSIILTGSRLGSQFQILDATTTDVVNGNVARKATTTLLLADIPKPGLGNATTTGATYTFDSIARTGLVIASFGNSLATSTITYRCLQN